MSTFNVYCDESCHLEHDNSQVMVLGCVYCPIDSYRQASMSIRAIKRKHGLSSDFEIKWTKVSIGKVEFYKEIIQTFFSDNSLKFRGVLIPNKDQLNHSMFNQDHDTWYYKMWYVLLKHIIHENHNYRIYLDIKDTRSSDKVKRLQRVISSAYHDFSSSIVNRIQHVRSHEVELMQVADLIMGAIGYENRSLSGNQGKLEVINTIKALSGSNLRQSTAMSSTKFNLFVWTPREGNNAPFLG